MSFPDSSVGKDSTCNAGDPSLIPGLGRSTGEGIGYPLQYSWASLVVQLVKNPPAMLETWVRSLGWEDPLEKGKATHSNTLAWRIPWTTVHGDTKSQKRLSDFHFHYITLYMLNTYYSDFSYSHCCSWIIYDQWAYVIICVHLTLFHVLNFILIQSTCVSSLLRFIWSSPDFSKSLFSFFLLSTPPPPEYQQLFWALTFTLKTWSKVKLLGNLISHLFCLWALCNSGWAIVLNRGEGFPWWSSGSEFTYQCREHRFHPWSMKVPHASGQLIPCATTIEA